MDNFKLNQKHIKKLSITLAVLVVMVAGGAAVSRIMETDMLAWSEDEALAITPGSSFTIVLDAGHGGEDGGATGVNTGTAEAGINLAVTRMVRDLLEQNGHTVILTRDSEDALAAGKQADMRARKAIMNGDDVDIVVSIHMNKFTDPSVHGPMVFYMKGAGEGQRLAECIIKSVCEATEHPARNANPGDYYVIRESKPPAALVECGFLSNAEEEARLLDEGYQSLIAAGIASGICAYIDGAS